MLATLIVCLAFLTPPQDRPTATQWVDQARAYLPAYSGEHRAFLRAAQKTEVQAASHILSAALALEPDNAYALWWKGHAQVLLGEDLLNRDQEEASRTSFAIALDCFDRAVTQQPDYLWAWYARAMAHQRLGSYFAAINDFERCIALAQETIIANADEAAITEARFLKYKARLWRSDCHMQVFAFETARQGYRAFYADNGNNAWDLGIKIAETYLRERDFPAALRTYEKLLEVPEYAAFDGAYTWLGYLNGLLGHPERAFERLNQALERERKPTLYPRLWLWILSPSPYKAENLEALKRFVSHPPGDLSPWDLQLGLFMTGELTVEEFLDAAQNEVERRTTEAIALDDLMCEVWFYTGLHQEQASAPALALDAYRKALTFQPAAFKWEWAYARKNFAHLMRQADESKADSPDPGPPGVTIVGSSGACASAVEDHYWLEVHRDAKPAGHLLLHIEWGQKEGPKPKTEVVGLN